MQWALIGIALAAALGYMTLQGWRFLRKVRKGGGSICGGCGTASTPRKTTHRTRLTLHGRPVDK